MFGRAMLLAVLVGFFGYTEVLAGPKVDPVTDRLCAGYEETIEGIWVDKSGWETLRFRFASDLDGSGCYAWLNPVPQWNISRPGSTLRDVRRDGALRALRPSVGWERGRFV